MDGMGIQDLEFPVSETRNQLHAHAIRVQILKLLLKTMPLTTLITCI